MKTCTAAFLLILLFFPIPRCEAVTARAVYDPDERSGESGFFDDAPLTQAQRDSLGAGGDDIGTLGEARRTAFGRVLCVLENRLGGDFTIRVSAGFGSFPGDSPTLITLAAAAPCHVIAVSETEGTGIGFPSALARARFGDDLIRSEGLCDAYDVKMVFNERRNLFHYGTGTAPRGTVDFTSVAMHEIFHGLGFFNYIEPDGSLLSDAVDDTGEGDGPTVTLSSVYDLMMYSRADDDLLVNLTDAQRRAAITSGDGLLWGGAAGRRAATSKSSGVASDGKPRLYAPSDYEPGSSVAHIDLSVQPDDLLEPFHNGGSDMTLALGLLEDMGWEINAGRLPQSCGLAAPSPSLPSAPSRPSSPAPAAPPVLPPIPVPPPLPEPVEVPAPTTTEAEGAEGTEGADGAARAEGGSGGCAVARSGGTGRPDVAFGGLLSLLWIVASAISAKRSR